MFPIYNYVAVTMSAVLIKSPVNKTERKVPKPERKSSAYIQTLGSGGRHPLKRDIISLKKVI